MYQIDNNTAAASPPASTAAGTPGYFTDGDPVLGVEPTVLPAEFMNALMRELLSVLSAAGISPNKSQFNQLLLAIESLVESRSGNYVLDTGAANAYVVALSPAISSYSGQNGLPVKFRATHVNTGASTLNAGGGAVPLVREDGAAVQSGDIPLNGIVSCTYDSTANVFLINSIVPSQLGALAKLNIGFGLVNDGAGNLAISGLGNYPVDTGAANAYVVALNPAITSYTSENGLRIEFRASHANTGASTLNAGGGVVSLLRDDGSAMQSGDILANAVVRCIYDLSGNAFLVDSVLPSQLGALAHEGIGQGLEDDGSGNLRVKLADSSLRRTSSGLGACQPITYIAGAVSAVLVSHDANLVSTAAAALSVAKTTTTFNGWTVNVNAQGGAVTLTPDAADSIGGAAAGATYVVAKGTSASFTGDGAGKITVSFQTPQPSFLPGPQYIKTTQSLVPGQYLTNSSGGAFTCTLEGAPVEGDSYRFVDGVGSWGTNNFTINPNGKTIMGSAENMICNVSGEDFMLWYNGSDWRLQ